MILALCWFKQDGCFGFVSRLSSTCWFGSSFRVSRGRFGFLRGKPCSSSHVGFHVLLCDVTALAVFDSHVCYLSQPVLRRDSSGPSFRRWRASFVNRKSYKRGSRESARTQRVVLNCPGLDIAHRWLVQSERRYGAEPRLHGCSCKALSCDEKLPFTPVLKLLPGLHIYNITTFVILLIHTFLQPFIQV